MSASSRTIASRPRLPPESFDERHQLDLDRIESANGDIIVRDNDYPCRYQVPRHAHERTQLLCVFAGVVLVETECGRFMIPPGHALLIPPRFPHAVSMLSDVTMRSLYVSPAEKRLVNERPLVLEVSDLARSLLLETIRLHTAMTQNRRSDLIETLLLDEILDLQERPLALPFPRDRRLAALCRDFLDEPSPNARLDDWAAKLAMSRRTFTRFFREETGVSFVAWRQQASVFSCLPQLADGLAITAVALAAGYESAAAFSTMFRRVLGTSPRSYVADGRSFAAR